MSVVNTGKMNPRSPQLNSNRACWCDATDKGGTACRHAQLLHLSHVLTCRAAILFLELCPVHKNTPPSRVHPCQPALSCHHGKPAPALPRPSQTAHSSRRHNSRAPCVAYSHRKQQPLLAFNAGTVAPAPACACTAQSEHSMWPPHSGGTTCSASRPGPGGLPCPSSSCRSSASTARRTPQSSPALRARTSSSSSARGILRGVRCVGGCISG